MPKFYLVSGPEGSTNRLTGRLLIAGGAMGHAVGKQPWDVPGDVNQVQLPPVAQNTTPVVLVRSVPHGTAWPRLGAICENASKLGYTPHLVVPVRHKAAIEASQKTRFVHPVEVEKQYRWIMTEIVTNNLPFTLAVFESFVVGHLAALNAFLTDLGLQPVERLLEAFSDTNRKYFYPEAGSPA